MARLIELDKEDLWDTVVGGSAISTGGGGIGPTREQFDAWVDPILEKGITPTLVDPASLEDDATIYMACGAGGGVRRADKERYPLPGRGAWGRPGFNPTAWATDRLREMDNLYPVGGWADLDNPETLRDEALDRMQELVGAPPEGFLPFEVSPNNFRQLLNVNQRGVPLVDADTAGFRAVPEISMSSLAVHDVPPAPAVFSSMWGDLMVLEKVVSWQRTEDINRHLAIVSGGGVTGYVALKGKDVRKHTFNGTLSRSRALGRTIREACDQGKDPANAAANATGGHVIFRGTIIGRYNEDHTAFIWGTELISGTGQWAGKTLKIWYKNENHMTWINDKPYVMSPDIITVLDAQTGYGLSNFDEPGWEYGREVAVLAVPCEPLWRTERGLRIFHPVRWGFACDYIPMEDLID